MNFTIPSKVYDVIKWVLIIFVPAFITLLSTLTIVWHWNIPLEAIVTTITAVATFLGALVGISTKNYNKLNNGADIPHVEGTDGKEV